MPDGARGRGNTAKGPHPLRFRCVRRHVLGPGLPTLARNRLRQGGAQEQCRLPVRPVSRLRLPGGPVGENPGTNPVQLPPRAGPVDGIDGQLPGFAPGPKTASFHPERKLKRRRRKSYTRILVITAVVLFILAVGFVLFNRNGVLALMRIRKRREAIEHQIDSLNMEVESLRTEIRMLRSDSLYMERKVREIMGWGRPGEFVVRFLDRTDE
ncbi:hypothetical protein GF402_02860 [Candidatus Fermentibacteria bacterium]|nr:hypothetical protein [Candidatus Fermentibacteria bacterium]